MSEDAPIDGAKGGARDRLGPRVTDRVFNRPDAIGFTCGHNHLAARDAALPSALS
jgi:hypothetical protein